MTDWDAWERRVDHELAALGACSCCVEATKKRCIPEWTTVRPIYEQVYKERHGD